MLVRVWGARDVAVGEADKFHLIDLGYINFFTV